MPVVGEAVLRGVLAHRRNDDAVRKRDGANLKGREELGRISGCHADFWMRGGAIRHITGDRTELAGEVSSKSAKERGLVSETKPLRRAGYVGEGLTWVASVEAILPKLPDVNPLLHPGQ